MNVDTDLCVRSTSRYRTMLNVMFVSKIKHVPTMLMLWAWRADPDRWRMVSPFPISRRGEGFGQRVGGRRSFRSAWRGAWVGLAVPDRSGMLRGVGFKSMGGPCATPGGLPFLISGEGLGWQGTGLPCLIGRAWRETLAMGVGTRGTLAGGSACQLS